MEKISTRLRRWADENDMTQRAIAEQVGVSHVTVGAWLSGKFEPKKEHAAALADLFDVPLPLLLYGREGTKRALQSANATTIAIPMLDAAVSCGGGAVPTGSDVVSLIEVGRDWLLKEVRGHVNLNALHIVTVEGDSMSPTVKAKDLAVVDTSQRECAVDGLYVLQFENSVFLKRVQRAPGRLLLISDNPAYETISVTPDENVSIVGKCVLTFNVNAV